MLHDVGKIALPDTVLLKPGRLDPDELALMREHPVVGDNCAEPSDRWSACGRSCALITNGRTAAGYPDRLSGDDIPLLAQIVAVVDVFDALTTNRPYRRCDDGEGRLRDHAQGGGFRLVSR